MHDWIPLCANGAPMRVPTRPSGSNVTASELDPDGSPARAQLIAFSRPYYVEGIALLTRPDAAMLLCQHAAGELLGSFHAQANGPLLYLSMLAVNPAGQAQGVGKFLLHAAENYGRQHGCTTSRMTVISVRSELIAYYERRGYHLTGATEAFPTDPRYGIPRQPLTLWVLEKVL